MSCDVIDRINSLFDFMGDGKLKESCRSSSSDFTRNSPLSFVNLVLIFLNNHGLSNTIELIKFFKQIGKEEVTKEAFSQARLKVKHIVFKNLKMYQLKMFYEGENVKKFKEHVLFAGDGIKVDLPFHKRLVKIFGGIRNKLNKIISCKANSSIDI
jgi:hypothetical protein